MGPNWCINILLASKRPLGVFRKEKGIVSPCYGFLSVADISITVTKVKLQSTNHIWLNNVLLRDARCLIKISEISLKLSIFLQIM